jgi:hypothetical protein
MTNPFLITLVSDFSKLFPILLYLVKRGAWAYGDYALLVYEVDVEYDILAVLLGE